MRLLLLPLMGLVMVGETFKTFQEIPSMSGIFYALPHPARRIAQRIMEVKMNGHNMPHLGMGVRTPPSVSTHSTRLAPTPTRRYPSFHDQTNSPSRDDQSSSSFNSDHNQSHLTVHQSHNPSSSRQPPTQSIANDKVFFPEPKPTVFVQLFKTPTFYPSHGFFSTQDVKSSSEQGNKPPSSDEDHKHSTFEQNQNSFDTDKKTSMFDTQGSQPHRNPVCNVLPDPGTCRAALPRYYLDPETGTCNCYLYGGCTKDGSGESPGSFFTLEECQRECHPSKMEEGPVCKDIFKEEQFVSFLDEPLPPKTTQTDHLNDDEFLKSFLK